jgi:crossover junction endodeoxyribonuclease RuvC
MPVLNRTIVGLDLSLTSTGIALVHPGGEITTKRVRSTGKKDDTWQRRYARLNALSGEISSYIPPRSLIVIESPSYASTTGSQHDRSGLWWLVWLATYTRHWHQDSWCDFIPVTPAQRMTYAVGKGGGRGTDKDNILAATIRRYPDIDITGNDIADAVILAAIGARLIGSPLEQTLPQANLRALQKLELPNAA